MSEIRMCVVFCLQMKKKSDFLFGAATLEKKRERERTREKRDLF